MKHLLLLLCVIPSHPIVNILLASCESMPSNLFIKIALESKTKQNVNINIMKVCLEMKNQNKEI